MFKHGLSNYFQKTNYKLYLFVLVLATVFSLSGCKSKSLELQTLENSVSILQLAKGREISRSTQDKGWALPQPFGQTQPEVSIEYEPINTSTKEDVYVEIAAILKKNHWDGSEPKKGYDRFDAYLSQGSFEISAGVRLNPDRNLVIVTMTIWPKSAELQAIETSISILQLSTGREVSRHIQEKGGISPALPVYPEISIVYEPINNHTKEDMYNEIVAILERNNWKRNKWLTDTVPAHFSGTLQQGRFEILGDVFIDIPDKNRVSVDMTIQSSP